MSHLRRRTVPLLAVVVGATVLGLAIPSPASAHTSLRTSDPAANVALPALPPAVRLTFTSSLTVTPKVDVLGPDGAPVNSGPVALTGASVVQPVQSAAAGGFTVNWSATAPDGHALKGSFTFTITTPAATTAAPSAPPTTTGGPAENGTPVAGAGQTSTAWWPWALGGVAIAALAVGAFFGTRRRRDPPGAA